MKIDLRSDFDKVYCYLESRVNNFNLENNLGPSPQSDGVSMIEIGYQYDQAGWIAIVFDMREKAEPDGEWTLHTDGNMLEMDHWFKAIDEMHENESSVEITLLDGKTKIVDFESEQQDFVCFGITIKEVLLKAKETGLLSKLPLSNRCIMGVEEYTGSYGWPNYEDRETEGNVHT